MHPSRDAWRLAVSRVCRLVRGCRGRSRRRRRQRDARELHRGRLQRGARRRRHGHLQLRRGTGRHPDHVDQDPHQHDHHRRHAARTITLDGLATTRLFRTTYQFASFTLTFRNLTLRNGRAPDYGGAIRLAYQDFVTTLVIENVTFLNNACDQAGNDVGGGRAVRAGRHRHHPQQPVSRATAAATAEPSATCRRASRSRTRCSRATPRTRPRASSAAWAARSTSTARADGQLVIRRSRFRSTWPRARPAPSTPTSTPAATGMTIEDCIVRGQHAPQQNGGAIYHQNGGLTIARSTFASNIDARTGRRLWLLQASPTSITNSTFTGNSATGIPPNNGSSGLGGAILINAANSRHHLAHDDREQPRGLGGRRHHRRHDDGSSTTLRGTSSPTTRPRTAATPGTSRTTARPAAGRRREPASSRPARTRAIPTIPTAPPSSPSAIRCWDRSRTTAGSTRDPRAAAGEPRAQPASRPAVRRRPRINAAWRVPRGSRATRARTRRRRSMSRREPVDQRGTGGVVTTPPST